MPRRLRKNVLVFNRLRKREMPKLKSKSGAKKRFSLTGSGKVRRNHAFKRHCLDQKPQKMKRKARGTTVMSDADARIVKKFLPYG